MSTLNVSVIVSAIDKLSGPLKDMGGQLEQFRGAGIKMAAAGAAITGSLLAVTQGAANVGDDIAKASDKIGVGVESLSRLRYAADQSGVAFESLQMALFRQARAAEAASRGEAESARVYEALGVSVTDTSGKIKDAETLFKETAEAISKVEDPVLRTSYAMQIFGRSGAQMLPLFKDGAAGIDELTARATKLGLVWSETAARDAERYNDALNDIKEAAGGLGRSMAVGLFPVLAGMSERLAEMVGRYTAWAEAHPTLSALVVRLGLGLGVLLSVVGSLLVALPFLANGWNVATAALTRANIQANIARVRLLWAGASARVSGLWAAVSAAGWNTSTAAMNGATLSTKAFLVSGIQAIPAVLGKVMLAMKAFAIGSYKFLLSPIGIITIAIAALIVELHYLFKAYKEMKDAMKQAEEKKAEAAAAEKSAQAGGYVTVESAAKSLGYSDKDIERGRYDKKAVEAERQRQIAARRARMGAGARGAGASAAPAPGTPASAEQARTPEEALKGTQEMLDNMMRQFHGTAGGGGGGGGWTEPAPPVVPTHPQMGQAPVVLPTAQPVVIPPAVPQVVVHEFRLSSDGETVRILTSNPAFGDSVRQVVREVAWKTNGYAPAL